MHNSQVQSSYNHFHYIYLSPPTAAHRLNILVKFFGPAGVQTPVYKQCTNLQIFRYLDRQKTGRQKKMAARTICGGYATIECYLKLTSPGSGLSCLPCGVSAVSICSPELLVADDSCALDSADIGRAAAACPV